MSRRRRPWWGRILRFLCCDEKSENECRAILGDDKQSIGRDSPHQKDTEFFPSGTSAE